MCEATRGSDGSQMWKGSGAARRVWARLGRGAMAGGVALVAVTQAGPAYAQGCARTIKADVVALDQPYMFNRLGAGNLSGQIFALRRDVVPANGAAGKVNLRPDKRPRPMVLRANVGDCLIIEFQNLLTPDSTGKSPGASLNAEGLEVADPATQVNQNSPVAPNGRQTYRVLREGGGEFPALQRRRSGWLASQEWPVRFDQRAAGRRGMVPQPGHPGGSSRGHTPPG